jgi:hypothetical protein
MTWLLLVSLVSAGWLWWLCWTAPTHNHDEGHRAGPCDGCVREGGR